MEDGQSDPTDKTRRRSLRRRIRYLSAAGTANWKMPGAFQWRILMIKNLPRLFKAGEIFWICGRMAVKERKIASGVFWHG